MAATFRRLAIADAGEAAMRLIQAVRELDDDAGDPIRIIALHTDEQRHARYVRHADEAVSIGPARPGFADAEGLARALAAARADAAWVGWGPAAGHRELADACARLGILFAGSEAPGLWALPDEGALIALAERSGLPVAPRRDGPVRRVEIDVAGDGGAAWALGVRDATLRHAGRLLLSESACAALDPALEATLLDGAAALARGLRLRGIASVAVLVDPEGSEATFLRVEPWLPAAHAVTEAVTGLDLVKLGLRLALGDRLRGVAPERTGWAAEARVEAEHRAAGAAAGPRRLELLRLPTGPGLRVDTGVTEGDGAQDGGIATVVAWGRDRAEALSRLRRALQETTVLVEGATTTQGLLLELLQRRELRAGAVDTTWIDRLSPGGEVTPTQHAGVALVQAAIELADAATAIDRARFHAFARRGRPQTDAPLRRTVELLHRGQPYRLGVARVGPQRHRVTLDGSRVEVEVEVVGPHERRLTVAGRSYRTLTSAQGADLLVEVNGVPHRLARDDGGIVRNVAPAVVVAIPVAVGDEVQAGDVVAVVESMKMESSFTAPFAGRVRAVLSGPNVQVGADAPLVQLEPLDRVVQPPADGERVKLPTPDAAAAPDAPGARRRLTWLMLGYDLDAADARAALEAPLDAAATAALLGVYADVQAVVRRPELLHAWLRTLDTASAGLPEHFTTALRRALGHLGVTDLDRTPALEEAGYRLVLADHRSRTARTAVIALLDRLLEAPGADAGDGASDLRDALERLAVATERRDAVVADLARECRWRRFDEPVVAAAREEVYAAAERRLDALAAAPDGPERAALIEALVACPRPLVTMLTERLHGAGPGLRKALLETMTSRYYRMRSLEPFEIEDGLLTSAYRFEGRRRRVATAFTEVDGLLPAARRFAAWARALPEGTEASADFYAEHRGTAPPHDELSATLLRALSRAGLPPNVHRIVIGVAEPSRGRGMDAVDLFTFRPRDGVLVEDELMRGLHPMMAHRLHVWRLANFALERLPGTEDVHLFRAVAHANPADERLLALAEVRDLTPGLDDAGRIVALPELERVLVQALEGMRAFQSHRDPSRRLWWNRVLLNVWPVIDLAAQDMARILERLAPVAGGLGLEMVLVQGRVRMPDGSAPDKVLRLTSPAGTGVVVEVDDPPTEPLQPLDEGARRVISARRRGTPHPAEVVRLLGGTFLEHDLDEAGELVPVHRAVARNDAGIVVGLTTRRTERHPEGMVRVALLGDPTKALGSLAEPECRRINAALDLAERLGVPVEWFAISAGARIAMDSGTENMDWIAAVLRRIIEFTQAGGELNVVVTGINVGAQPYWNAEATMLMHTKGILVMTPASAMVLTGKQALDYSGGVSAEDNFGIGGYERIMGPNGQAQYWAPDLAAACRVLLDHYEHTYVVPGERFPRRAVTTDPRDRDVRPAPHAAPGSDLTTVGAIFSDAENPGRKKAFDIRSVMRAVADADLPPLERWAGMRDAESAVVWDAHLGGWPVAMLGLESRPLPRYGPIPADGPDRWTSGTLFPRSSKKIARAVNAASGRRPLVVLANLAGFDGSPESMRSWQLEFGAEIGRAVVNFEGPIVFCVVARYHGGAFVVFSTKLNDNLEAIALEGSKASVIGGAPAAAVVFARDVDVATREDPRITELDERLKTAEPAERAALRGEREVRWATVHAEKLGELAARFDAIHSVERAVEMGSVHRIVAPALLRPFLIEAVERGMRRAGAEVPGGDGAGVAHPIAG